MKKSSENPVATATELLAERRKYEGWITALMGRRSSTPDHVFARVLADYEARLDAVVSQLTTRADALDVRVAELTARLGALDDDVRRATDERAEAELRAHVGELDGGAWDEAARSADARLEALAGERSAVNEELEGLREMLQAARSPTPTRGTAAISPAPSASDASAGAAARADVAAGSPQHDAFAPDPAAPPVAPAPPGRGTPGFDELAFLRDVTGADATAAGGGPPVGGAQAGIAAGGGAQADATPAGAAQAGATTGNSAAPQPAAASDHAAEAPEPVPQRPINDALGLVLPDERPAIAPRRASVETSLGALDAADTPIVLHTEGKQAKTLKCSDCGSMNYPTEWYCERCGAELSAL